MNSGENKGLSHVILANKLRVEHKASQTQMIRRFRQEESRSTEHVMKILSPLDFKSLCQQRLDTSRECFQLDLARARERVMPPTSSLHFLQSSENPNPSDIGSIVTSFGTWSSL